VADRPNILFVFTDQQTFNAMSGAGNRYCHTPYMDALAADGMRFDLSYCSNPVCGPSRATLVTGRMPHEAGVVYNNDPLDPAVPTVGELLRASGYHTVWIGKWHLPDSYPNAMKAGQVRGFDFKPLPTGLNTYGGGAVATDPHSANDAYFQLRWNIGEQDRPWMLGVSLHNPHDICAWTGRPPVAHTNLDCYPPIPDNFERPEGESELIEWCRQRDHYGGETRHTVNWSPDQWRAYLRAYFHYTEQVDDLIGRVWRGLEAGGWLDNTLVIFTSDHGENCAAHRFVVKLTPYEQATRVPLIMRFPGSIPAGVVDRDHLVSGLDIVPTICDYAGVEGGRFTGRSLRPLLEQQPVTWRDHVVCAISPSPPNPDVQLRLVRSRRYKYVACSGGQRPEMLFDLEQDPGETRNLAYDADQASVVDTHRQWLGQWLDDTKDRFSLPPRQAS
jgi:arylsulfatase A-like enzyme